MPAQAELPDDDIMVKITKVLKRREAAGIRSADLDIPLNQELLDLAQEYRRRHPTSRLPLEPLFHD